LFYKIGNIHGDDRSELVFRVLKLICVPKLEASVPARALGLSLLDNPPSSKCRQVKSSHTMLLCASVKSVS